MAETGLTLEIIRQIRGYEKAATAAKWTARGNELYYSDGRKQTFDCAEDARLVAVMRDWLTDLLDVAEKQMKSEANRVRDGTT